MSFLPLPFAVCRRRVPRRGRAVVASRRQCLGADTSRVVRCERGARGVCFSHRVFLFRCGSCTPPMQRMWPLFPKPRWPRAASPSPGRCGSWPAFASRSRRRFSSSFASTKDQWSVDGTVGRWRGRAACAGGARGSPCINYARRHRALSFSPFAEQPSAPGRRLDLVPSGAACCPLVNARCCRRVRLAHTRAKHRPLADSFALQPHPTSSPFSDTRPWATLRWSSIASTAAHCLWTRTGPRRNRPSDPSSRSLPGCPF